MVSAVSDWGGRGRPAIADPQKGTITMTPEYGDERQDRENALERDMKDRDLDDRELAYLNPEDNEAHAPAGCVRGLPSTATKDKTARTRSRGI